jgi:hypothetical protein
MEFPWVSTFLSAINAWIETAKTKDLKNKRTGSGKVPPCPGWNSQGDDDSG